MTTTGRPETEEHQIEGFPVTVERHKIDAALARRRAATLAADLSDTIAAARRSPQVLHMLYRNAASYAGYLSVEDPASDTVCWALRIAEQALIGLFALASAPPGESVPITLDRTTTAIPAVPLAAYTQASTWEVAFYLAILLRDAPALDALCAIPTALLRASDIKEDDYAYLFVDTLRATWRRDPEAEDLLLAAIEATDDDRTDPIARDFVLDIAVPQMELLYKVFIRDVDGFNASLAKALDLYRRYRVNNPRLKQNPRGYLAIGPTAMAALAYEAGMPIRVASDYMPPRLVRGECT